MKADNFIVAMHALAMRLTFAPYYVELASGTVIRVTHREAMALKPSAAGDIVEYVHPTRGHTVFDVDAVVQICEYDPRTS